MAGTFTLKNLAFGVVATTKGTIYTVPAVTIAVVKKIVLFNINAAQQTVNVYVNDGTSRQVDRRLINQWGRSEIYDWVLNAGDLIEADTTTVSATHYLIMGTEET